MSSESENPETPATKLLVWFANTSSGDPGQVESCCESWLNQEEIDRANRFRQPTSRNQHVVGRGMARRLLGEDEISPLEIQFGEAVHGKPYVVEPNEAKQPFNIAHTDGLVLCGIGGANHELVGVDVEKLGRSTESGLAERFFSEPEVDYLNTKSDEVEYQDAFLRVWTLKESFIKAIGTGLQTPLADFAFVDVDSSNPSIRLLDSKLQSEHRWHFFSFQPKQGFVAAVAVACSDPNTNVEIEVRCFDDLVS